ncbi:DUF6992 family protein [Hymenobacter sp. B1770]|uniref:DUF6992 family protein n=1 Tax=Hymenobacter sp. B1770 TaxID=1718788 RepID=UPI003CEA0A7B
MPEIASLFLASELLIGRGLAVLAAWALLNLVVSGYFVARTDRRHEPYYFHGMNVSWGLVNAGLACWGVLHLHFTAPAGLQLGELIQNQLLNENLFVFNTGLDAAYVMTGFYLWALAQVPGQARPARLRGFGRSLWLQGGFLLVFDAVMWGLLHGQGQSWLGLLA